MRRLLVAVAVLLGVLAPGSPAWAHASLVAADPVKDSTLTAAPAGVTLEFNERLNPDFTTIVVSDAAKQRVPASGATVDDVRGKVTFTGGLPANGVYTVAYRVVSVDGHTVQGSYTFTLADPDLPDAPAAPAPSTAAMPGPADDTEGLPTGLLIGLGVAGGVLVVGAGAWFVAGRRRSL